MTGKDVRALLDLFEGKGLDVWLDGGWAVDALLGEQTRPHGDLDIVIQEGDVSIIRELLASRGYGDSPRQDTRPWNFVLADNEGREVDVHVMTMDADGKGIYGPAESGEYYPAESLTGTGEVGGKIVKCITADWLVRWRIGYELDENDHHDILSLHDRFGVEFPAGYRKQEGRC
jgi:lincosamide nucleotidyltransferase A/C/D/E